jgi:hypothetical protein
MSQELVKRLVQKLEEERPGLEALDSYYEATQPLAFLAPEVRELVGRRLQNLNIPLPGLVVDSIEERLDVEGFRLADDADPDSELWETWQRNNLDEESQQAHADALIAGRSFATVWADDDGEPLISVESAHQMYLEHHPATRERLHALKLWKEPDEDRHRAVLYLPDSVTHWTSKGKGVTSVGEGWTQTESLDNPLGVVNVVPIVNRPRRMKPHGRSELQPLLPMFDAINKLGSDMMVSSEFHAMPRRVATGVEIAEEPVLDTQGQPTFTDDGEPITKPVNPFDRTPGRTWIVESPEAQVSQLPEADLRNFLEGIKTLAFLIAALAGLPPHYVALSSSDNPSSADAIRSAEASLVKRVVRRQRSFGGSWEEVMRLAHAVQRGGVPDEMNRLETVWANPETRTIAQDADAALKPREIGVPEQALWERVGFSPVEIERFRSMKRQAAADSAVVDIEKLTNEQ